MTRWRSSPLLALLLVCTFSAAWADDDPPRRYTSAGGVTVGLPQIIAVTAEKVIAAPFRVQANLGSAVALTSLNGRFLAVADELPVQPYAFLGAGLFHALHYEDPSVVPYGWYGLGLRLKIDRVLLFGEAGRVTFEPSQEGGRGSAPVGAVGFLVEY